MAVAVKNPPVAPTSSPLDRMAVVSLVGTAYVVVSLGIVLEALPYLWRFTGLAGVGGAALLGLAMLAVAAGLAVLGVRLFGANRPAGARAGIFMGLVAFVVFLFLTRWVSLWLEYWVFANHWLGDSPAVGLALTGVAFLALLVLEGYLFFRPEVEQFLVRMEGQGWFSATSYKGQQGQRVRRGTILGLLLIAGSGVYTMMNNGLLSRMPQSLWLNVPFSGSVAVEDPGDAGPLLKDLPPKDKDQVQIVAPGASAFHAGEIVGAQDYRNTLQSIIEAGRTTTVGDTEVQALGQTAKDALKTDLQKEDISEVVHAAGSSDALVAAAGPTALTTLPPPGLPTAVLRLNQYTLRDVNDRLRGQYVLVANPGLSNLRRGAVVPRKEFDDAGAPFTSAEDKPSAAVPFAATGAVWYEHITLLPALQYTLPVLLIAVALWAAWRVVNYPAFADFLIATEAELNKVSWTTRPRLIQDTIVVLVTTLLLAAFLFLMDQTWRVVLSWKPIGVLQLPKDQGDQNLNAEQKPW